MSVWRSVFAGMLGLGLLEATVSSTAAAGRAGGLLTGVANCINHVLNPTVAAIPDLRKHGGAAPRQSAAIIPATDAGPAASGPSGSLLPTDWSTSVAGLYV